jgi:hypothetical protein
MKFDGMYHIQVFVMNHICLLSVTTFIWIVHYQFTEILQK